ncbi:protein of unknown function [Burkholderia multivorans]
MARGRRGRASSIMETEDILLGLALATLAIGGVMFFRKVARGGQAEQGMRSQARPLTRRESIQEDGFEGSRSSSQLAQPSTPAPASSASPGAADSIKRPKRSVTVGIAVFSGKLRDKGAGAERAGELLAKSAYWWVGSPDDWNGKAEKDGFAVLPALPEGDNTLLVATFDAELGDDGIPASRLEGAAWLREAARNGLIKARDIYLAPRGIALSQLGFNR